MLGLDHIRRKVLIHGVFGQEQATSDPHMPDFLLRNQIANACDRPSGTIGQLLR
ncbi:hypothetical protein SAMN02927900_02504 [Rhizobium mongolense subsp. loessense]|uniref:Uncharacterized protein n=1 Tax=Rhizobium mongolense subsp. loessense TaxID=158890 RepID=A0A1G4RDV6_9HYPH|nr:hypothetical protein SAMN02927900_02504 [Rhizobium mongolense subsp. loessense]